MNKLLERSCYSVVGMSLLGIYTALFLGITPSILWDSFFIESSMPLFKKERSQYAGVLPQISPNLYVRSAEELMRAFEARSFSLEDVRQGQGDIPRLYLAKLPRDFKKRSLEERKSAFLQTVLPIILEVNQGILKMRGQVEQLQEKMKKGGRLSQEEEAFLADLYEDYSVKERTVDRLLQKVDIIPISLTLAQGILESGWGTSSLAEKANSLFGHTNANNTMKKFPTLVNTVEYHVRNLNKHAAYKDFRKRRALLRKNGKLDAHHLAEGLKPYSERGMRYVQDIRKIMKQYQLYQFDQHLSFNSKNAPLEKKV